MHFRLLLKEAKWCGRRDPRRNVELTEDIEPGPQAWKACILTPRQRPQPYPGQWPGHFDAAIGTDLSILLCGQAMSGEWSFLLLSVPNLLATAPVFMEYTQSISAHTCHAIMTSGSNDR